MPPASWSAVRRLFFGRIGDLVGRKYTFLVTIIVMGFSTFAVGLLPTYASVGWAAPILMVMLRLLQGLALGGEYGGAATYVAEHATPGKRGYDTAWIQTTATLGLFLALHRDRHLPLQRRDDAGAVRRMGLAHSVPGVGRPADLLGLHPAEAQRIAGLPADEGRGQGIKAPLTDSFLRYPNNKYVLLALLGATAGQGVVWYTGQFYALFFLTITLKVDGVTAYTLIAISLLLGTPFFIVFGWLSDKIGRLKIILAGCLIAAVTYFPLFQALTHYVNPALEAFQEKTPISVAADPAQCELPHLRRPVVEVHRVRQDEGLPDQVRSVVHVDRCARRVADNVHQDRRHGTAGLRRGEDSTRRSRKRAIRQAADKSQINWRHDAADPVHHS